MKSVWTSAIASTVFFVSGLSNSVSAISLYNGTGTPGSQVTLQLGSISSTGTPVLSSETALGAGAGVRVNTLGASGNAEYSGYSNYNPAGMSFFNPTIFNSNTLDQSTGYSLTFTLQLNSATNITGTTLPRSAFSVIAISSDQKGIEIGFRPDEIFAQSSTTFATQDPAKTAVFDTSLSTTYKLTVFNNNYSLFNGATEIISGALLGYSFDPVASMPPLIFNPYTTGSFLFFGDNTGQESGIFTLGQVDLDTTPIPFDFSPTGGLLALGAIAGARHIHRKLKEKSKT